MCNAKDRWRSLCKTISAKKEVDFVWEWIYAAYNEPHRYYHTLDHITDCLKEYSAWRHLLPRDIDQIIEFSIFCHDLVYDTKALDNEEKSAALAKNILGVLGAANKNSGTNNLSGEVEKMILASKHNWKNLFPRQVNLFLDIDLVILGRPEDIFDKYDTNIRKEYEWVPLEIYKQKRKSLLSNFLKQDHIYMTPEFQEKYEVKARSNLGRAIERLV